MHGEQRKGGNLFEWGWMLWIDAKLPGSPALVTGIAMG
jgi:hypothetical protein